jgi:hypothetical protein
MGFGDYLTRPGMIGMPSLVKKEQLAKVNLGAIPKAYDATVGAHPIVETGLWTGAGALAGRYGGPFLLRHLLKGVSRFLPEDKQQLIQQYLDDPANEAHLKNVMTAVGGLAGLLPLAKNMDIYHGVGGAAGSMLKGKDYWAEHPEYTPEARKRNWNRYNWFGYGYMPQRNFQWKRAKDRQGDLTISKKAEDAREGDPFYDRSVPINFSMGLIKADPFLTLGQKRQTSSLLFGAENRSTGLTTGQKLMTSAVKAGVGFGTAYLFGRVMGGLLSLPPSVTESLSRAGGIAGALVETRLFEDLRK